MYIFRPLNLQVRQNFKPIPVAPATHLLIEKVCAASGYYLGGLIGCTSAAVTSFVFSKFAQTLLPENSNLITIPTTILSIQILTLSGASKGQEIGMALANRCVCSDA